jgi:hypothetical protein
MKRHGFSLQQFQRQRDDGGKIRFVGGPWHNTLPMIRPWPLFISIYADSGKPYDCRYKLKGLETETAVFFEYHWEHFTLDSN